MNTKSNTNSSSSLLFSKRDISTPIIDSRSIERPNTTTNSLLFKNPRLDIYPSVRQLKPFNEIRHSSNLGPGSYEFYDYSNRPQSTNSRTGFTISRTIVHPDHSIIRRSAAPPVGTYNVPRIMSPPVPGSELGVQITSSFMNGGRRKELINDAVHFNTMKEDIKMSNLGPGTYDLPDNWSPSAFNKYNKKPGKSVEKKYNHQTYEKPWKVSKSPSLSLSKDVSSSAADTRNDMFTNNNDELTSEILRVKKLPTY